MGLRLRSSNVLVSVAEICSTPLCSLPHLSFICHMDPVLTFRRCVLSFEWVKVTAILATMMERGDIVSLLARIEAKVTFDDSVGKQLGVISVKDLKKILDSMKAADW